MDTSKATVEWLNSRRQTTRWQYQNRWEIWLEYCKTKGLLLNGSEQLEDTKKRRQSSDNTVKFFYDNEVPKFFQWLTTEYKGKTTNEPLSESSALSVTTAVRSFFRFHRYSIISTKPRCMRKNVIQKIPQIRLSRLFSTR